MPTKILVGVAKLSRGPEMNFIECSDPSEASQELPSDYESCGTCGFDHAYEPNEAQTVHEKLDEQDIDSHERF
jgi:hypothetical protein